MKLSRHARQSLQCLLSGRVLRGVAAILLSLSAAGNLAAQAVMGTDATPSKASGVPAVSNSPAPIPVLSLEAKPKIVKVPQQTQGRLHPHPIEVSGWWVIDIKDPDGRLVNHQEFENGLTTGGTQLLAYLLSGQVTTGQPSLVLGTSSGACLSDQCTILTGAGLGCPSNLTCATGLTATVLPDTNLAVILVLAGQIVAPNAGAITSVGSLFFSCSNQTVTPASPITSIDPVTCMSYAAKPASGLADQGFTYKSFSPFNVKAGQTVQVSVTFSFKSLV